MKINYKRATYIFATAFVLSLLATIVVFAGNTDSPASPTDPTSQMYTLEQIYDRLATGNTGSKMIAFTEPVAGPGTGTMYTLDDIIGAAPEVNATGAIPTEVRAGKTYWGLTTTEWGLQTGSLYGGCDCANGTLNGTRWCDNGDGTVTDLLGNNGKGVCLVWLKDANCSANLNSINKTGTLSWSNALIWSSGVQSGYCGLSDGSIAGDWRLPTKEETYALAWGTERVRSGTPRAFTNVQAAWYWTGTTDTPTTAWIRYLFGGGHTVDNIANAQYVWPVRIGP